MKKTTNMPPEYWKNLSLEDIIYIDPEGKECIERWLPVKGYKGLYEVSNCGRVKSLHREPKISTLTPSDDRGYLRASLSKNGIDSRRYIHILVGRHFIPNPERKRTVNHKKGIKYDNRYFELEWHTYSENHKHAYEHLGRISGLTGKTGYSNKSSKEIICVTTGKKYGSISEAGRLLKIPFQNISKVCKGKRPSAHGFIFKYTDG